MGNHDAQRVAELYNAGDFIVAQDEQSSVVYDDMTREVMMRNAAHSVRSLEKIAVLLNRFTDRVDDSSEAKLFGELTMAVPQIYNIRSVYDIITARMQVRETARSIGMDLADQARLSLATSSLLEGLGLGINSDSSSVSIESLSEGQNKGLRVICTFHDSIEHRPVKMATGNVDWMVDTIDIRNLTDDQVEISMTKWVMRKQQ
jgi:hypothetical protein